MYLAHPPLDRQAIVNETLADLICLREVREFIAGDDPPTDADAEHQQVQAREAGHLHA